MLHIRNTHATPVLGIQRTESVYTDGTQIIVVSEPWRRYLIADILSMAKVKCILIENGIKLDDEYYCEPPHYEDESDDEITIYKGHDDLIIEDPVFSCKESDGSLYHLLYYRENEPIDPKEQYL